MKNTLTNKILFSPVAYTYYFINLLILPWLWIGGLLVLSVGSIISIGDGPEEFRGYMHFLKETFIFGIVNPILWHINYWRDFNCSNMLE